MTEPRRILVVFPYEDEYGPFRTLRFVLNALADDHYIPICVVPKDSPAARRLTELGVETRPVTGLNTFPRTLNPRRLVTFLRQHLGVADQIQQLALGGRAELVYSMSEAIFCGSLAATRMGIPSISHVIGLSIGSPAWSATAYIRLLDRLTTRFVACSAAVAEMLENYGVDEERITVVHSGLALDEIDAFADAPSPISHAGPKIGMVAAYDARKGHELFVDAAAIVVRRHPDARFYIVGGVLQHQEESVAFHRRVQHRITHLGLQSHVVSVGHVSSKDVYAWLRALDVFVLPSKTEAFGYVQFEAMACARPVIATRVEGSLDAFIDGHSGIYVPLVPSALAEAEMRLIEDREFANRLGTAGRERVMRFFDERLVVPVLLYAIEATLSARTSTPRLAFARD
jgi:glycosyltransferase involved in cell wall biosynthesis